MRTEKDISEEENEKMIKISYEAAEKYWDWVTPERNILHKYHGIVDSFETAYSNIEKDIESMVHSQTSICTLEQMVLIDTIKFLRMSFERLLDYMETVSGLDKRKKEFEESKK